MMRALVLGLVALLAAACADPVPPERAAYVGDWRGKDMRLAISSNGYVDYERRSGNNKVTIQAPLKKFEGDNFVVGFGPAHTTFVVTKPPYRDGATWKMVVDGVELTKHYEVQARATPPSRAATSG